MAGPDVREILIYFMQMSLGPFHKLTVGAERWSISQVVSPKHFPQFVRVSRGCLARDVGSGNERVHLCACKSLAQIRQIPFLPT